MTKELTLIPRGSAQLGDRRSLCRSSLCTTSLLRMSATHAPHISTEWLFGSRLESMVQVLQTSQGGNSLAEVLSDRAVILAGVLPHQSRWSCGFPLRSLCQSWCLHGSVNFSEQCRSERASNGRQAGPARPSACSATVLFGLAVSEERDMAREGRQRLR